MQSLDVISVNLWQTLISLCNLLLLFLILKRFLYKPVKRVLAERRAALDQQYAAADEAQRQAEAQHRLWEQKIQAADEETEELLKKAVEQANFQKKQILQDAKERGSSIIHEAETQAILVQKKAQDEIKKEIVDVSAAMTEKIMQREICFEDHRAIIASVLSEIGEDNDRD